MSMWTLMRCKITNSNENERERGGGGFEEKKRGGVSCVWGALVFCDLFAIVSHALYFRCFVLISLQFTIQSFVR